ncbi:MAG: DUF4292 domain-containing protein [Bacteroidota bacterium]
MRANGLFYPSPGTCGRAQLMHMRQLSFFLVLICLFTATCNKNLKGKDGRDGLTSTSKAARVIKGMEENAFTTEFLEARARVKVESKKLNVGGTAIIRLERDKAIWMSVKKFGFEGARALIRPDSFFVLNRLNGDYTAEPLSYIEEKYKIPARFDLLQEIVLGNAVFFTRKLDMDQEGEIYELTGKDTRFATRYWVDGRGFQLREMELTELAQDRTLTITNNDYRATELTEQPDFAHERTVAIEADATGSARMEMTFTKLEFAGPLAMPFKRR